MKKQSRKKGAKSQRQPGVAGAVKAARKQPKPKKQLEATTLAPAAGELAISATPPAQAETSEPATPEPAANPVRFTPPKHITPWHHIAVTSGGALVALALLLAVANVFLGTVRIGNSLVSGRLSDVALRQRIAAKAAAYTLPIAYPDGHTKRFSLQAIGLQTDIPKTVTETRKAQLSPLHLLTWWQPVTVRLDAKVDAKTMGAFVAQNASIVTQPAHNAELSIANGVVQIAAGTTGKQYGLENAAPTILAAAATLQDQPLRLRPVALQPSITVPALAHAKAQLETTLHQHITITIGDQTVTPSAADIAQWVALTPTATTVNITVDNNKLHDYLDDLASSHSAPARSQVILDTTGAQLQAGQRGIAVGDVQDATETIAQNLLNGKGAQLSLPVQYTAFDTVRAPTAGKWIEVDVSTKRMYAYDQGQLVRSFLVSAGAAGTPTVIGRFAIYSKYRSQDMFGGNVDGSSYFQPDVPYVNYFYRDYAIHGNYWRPASYFGNVNSSHGCVGVPVSDGAWIYSWAPIGTPVIVHS